MGGLVAGSILSLGVSAVHRKADDLYPLAPRRIPVVLALEVSTSWPSSAPQELASADLHHGKRESELGRTADCRRAIAEAEVTGGPKDGGQISEACGAPAATAQPAMGNICPESCQCDHRLRLLYLGDGNIPGAVCVCCESRSVRVAFCTAISRIIRPQSGSSVVGLATVFCLFAGKLTENADTWQTPRSILTP